VYLYQADGSIQTAGSQFKGGSEVKVVKLEGKDNVVKEVECKICYHATVQEAICRHCGTIN